MTKQEAKKPSAIKFAALAVLATTLGVIMVAAGAFLCVTIVFAPVGFVLIMSAGVPLGEVMKYHLRAEQRWKNRDRELDAEGNNDGLEPIPPWMQPGNSRGPWFV